MKIDIERLIDAVAAENEAYNEYCYSSKTLYRGPFEEITTRKNHVNYAREVHDREQSAVDTLAEVFQMDTETRNRLYIAARAVNRWRNATQWARLIPGTMQDQIRRFIFGEAEAPNSTYKYLRSMAGIDGQRRISRPGSAGYIERSEALGWLINI